MHCSFLLNQLASSLACNSAISSRVTGATGKIIERSLNIEHKNGMPEAVMEKARVAGDFYTRRPISGWVHLDDDAGDALPGFWGDIRHPSAGRSRELDLVRSITQIEDRYGSLATDSRIVEVYCYVVIAGQFPLVFSPRRGADPNHRRERARVCGNSSLHRRFLLLFSFGVRAQCCLLPEIIR